MSPASACCLAQLKAQSHALDLGSATWRPFSVCRGRRQRKLFFATPSTAATYRSSRPRAPRSRPCRRGIVQFGRSATGASSRGVTTRSAASLFTGGGPGATVAFQRRDTAARELAAPQTHRVFAHAEGFRNRADWSIPTRSAISPAPDQPRRGFVNGANVSSALRCASPAVTRDLPAMTSLPESTRRPNHTYNSLVKLRESALARQTAKAHATTAKTPAQDPGIPNLPGAKLKLATTRKSCSIARGPGW